MFIDKQLIYDIYNRCNHFKTLCSRRSKVYSTHEDIEFLKKHLKRCVTWSNEISNYFQPLPVPLIMVDSLLKEMSVIKKRLDELEKRESNSKT